MRTAKASQEAANEFRVAVRSLSGLGADLPLMRIEEELANGGRREMTVAGVREATPVKPVHHPPVRIDDQGPVVPIPHRHCGFCEQGVFGYQVRFVDFDAHDGTAGNRRAPGPLAGLPPNAGQLVSAPAHG